MATIAEQLMEKGEKRGIEKGEARGRRDAVLRLLQRRFGPLPAEVCARVE